MAQVYSKKLKFPAPAANCWTEWTGLTRNPVFPYSQFSESWLAKIASG